MDKIILIFLDCKRSAKQKCSPLLHCAGSNVQDIFETLTDTRNDEDYNTALEALDGYFKPSVNTPYKKHSKPGRDN